jgi:hypothetical protein
MTFGRSGQHYKLRGGARINCFRKGNLLAALCVQKILSLCSVFSSGIRNMTFGRSGQHYKLRGGARINCFRKGNLLAMHSQYALWAFRPGISSRKEEIRT